MIRGSTPACPYPTSRPIGFRPARLTNDPEANWILERKEKYAAAPVFPELPRT